MNRNFKGKIYFIFLVINFFIWQPVVFSQVKVLPGGDKISWDGQYYDFRDSAGNQMIKLWIPPGIKPVKGIFISGHGGGSGDSRNFARDENMRAFAMRLGFAVAGLHNFPGRRAYDQGAGVFFKALDQFAGMGIHPELSHIPFVMYGSSNGGATTYGFVNFAPQRAICFLANVSAGGSPDVPVDEALRVPGIFIMGQFDALIRQRGIDRTRELVSNARQKGALWSWAVELKGHEDGYSFDLYMKFVEQAVKARYPKNADPERQDVSLLDIPERMGWLCDLSGWDSGLCTVAAYDDYKGKKEEAGWLLNEDIAWVYRSLATHYNPLRVSVKEFDRTYNPNTDPGTMFSLGGPVCSPAETIHIVCEADRFPDWQKIEFFNGSLKLGEVRKGQKPEITTKLSEECQVYCLLALATDSKGIQRTSQPMHFFVRDPGLVWKIPTALTSYKGIRTGAGAAGNLSLQVFTAPDPADSILTAYALDKDMEAGFSSVDGKPSAFWDKIDESHDYIAMSQRNNAAGGAAFNFVLTHDCNMDVKAAYGSDGLYLLFIINDDNDVAWPNRLAGTENEQFYLDFDAVDLLIDSRPVEEICSAGAGDILVSKSFGLTSSTRQYQVACGTEKERPAGFKRALADPWDFHSTYFTFADAKSYFGIEIENLKTAYYFKQQEWFIPWSEVGAGFQNQPQPGTRIAFSPGYNDRDEGEHFPPGMNSSGGSVKASNGLRWRNHSDPWGSGKAPYNWGEIELGPGLGR